MSSTHIGKPRLFMLVVAISSCTADAGEDIATAESALNQGNVALCHRPPGNPDNARSIVVGESAVSAHLDHGDALGDCPGAGSCGDGVVQDSEGCDPPDFGDSTCEDLLGAGATGVPACTETCELAQGSCQLCPNGIVEGTEECDDGNTNPADGCNLCIVIDDEQD